VNSHARYLKDIPIGYNPKDVMMIPVNSALAESYDAVVQELTSLSFVEEAAGAQHYIGSGRSGQSIGRLNDPEGVKPINEYRVMPGLGELMQFELVEGEFFRKDVPTDRPELVLNEATVEMLGLEYPVVGQQVNYRTGPTTVVGVVKDFVYDDPSGEVQPLALAPPWGVGLIYVRLLEGTDRLEAQSSVQTTLRKFDPDFMLSPVWSEDIYENKFAGINSMGRIIFIGSLLSIVLAMLGLLAIHLYSAFRRTKEIAIRRINGAERTEIFLILSKDMLKWILVAGVVAVPIAWYLATNMFSSTTNHVSLGWWMFATPVLIQMAAALVVTSGISIRASLQNPVKALKTE
jgi:putative ABC transport system permease protein